MRKLEGDLFPKRHDEAAEKTPQVTHGRDRTKTDTGRLGEYPKALERTVVKELGKMTP